MKNGVSETTHLSEDQLKPLQKLLGPLVGRLQILEVQANEVRQSINAIAGTYLTELGLPSEVSVDLKTGALTPIQVIEPSNG